MFRSDLDWGVPSLTEAILETNLTLTDAPSGVPANLTSLPVTNVPGVSSTAPPATDRHKDRQTDGQRDKQLQPTNGRTDNQTHGQTDKQLLVPDYQILSSLGRGKMADTYKAIYMPENRTCALKVARPHARAKLREEIQIFQELPTHPNLVRLFRYGDRPDSVWLDIELVRGQPLQQLLPKSEDGPFRTHLEVLYWFRQLFQALSALHQARIVHTDVHELNVLVDSSAGLSTASLRLLDYNLAKRWYDAESCRGHHRNRQDSPERASKGRYDRTKDDVWAASLLMSKLVTGWCVNVSSRVPMGSCHDIFANSTQARHTAQLKATARHPLYGLLLNRTLTAPERDRLNASALVALLDECIREMERSPGVDAVANSFHEQTISLTTHEQTRRKSSALLHQAEDQGMKNRNVWRRKKRKADKEGEEEI
eukprot:g4042.t1